MEHPMKECLLITYVEECKSCWAFQLCHGGCASQKHSMGRRSNQPYSPGKCELDKILYEFVIRAYYEYSHFA